MNLAEAIPPLVKLNAWARSPYEAKLDMHNAADAVYAMKRKCILAAIDSGQCETRIVSVERKCKTCGGTGMFKHYDRYDYDYWEGEDCRRCNSTGNVVLRFAETKVLGASFHTPRPKADFLAPLRLDWEKCESTDWTPEQPGRPLSRWEMIVAINELERAIFWPQRIHWKPDYYLNVYAYSIHFGHVTECFVCGHPSSGDRYSQHYGQDIYRPAMRWRQSVCDSCDEKARRWPRQWPANIQNPRHDRGKWISELPSWPMNAPMHPWAETEVVREWLARRGIVIGEVPPSDYCFMRDTGEMIEIIGHVDGVSQVKFVHDSFRHSAQDIVPTSLISGYPQRRLTA